MLPEVDQSWHDYQVRLSGLQQVLYQVRRSVTKRKYVDKYQVPHEFTQHGSSSEYGAEIDKIAESYLSQVESSSAGLTPGHYAGAGHVVPPVWACVTWT